MDNRIELSPSGNMLMYKKGHTPDFVKEVIRKKDLKGLRIFDHLDRLNSLDFLKEYYFLEGLDIDCIYDQDYSFLLNLQNLKILGIGHSTQEKNAIDLSNLKNLEYLAVQWRKAIIGLDGCTSLTSLVLVDFKEQDLLKLANLKNLKELRIKTASIEVLSGLDGLENIESISLGNCKKLSSLKAIDGLPKLRHLEINKCTNIRDYEKVTNLRNLESLSLIDCGNIQSIKFIENYPLLSKLSLLGNTIVADGNLLPAKNLKSVEHKHYKHYNVKIEDAAYNQNVKSNLQKIKNLFK